MTETIEQALQVEAVEQLAAIRAYRTYKGSDLDYARRAKVAISMIGAYVRLRATIANERSNELIAQRLGLVAPPTVKALDAADES